MGCAFGAEQKRAATRLFFFARAPLLAYGNTPARLPVQSASESAALGKAGHRSVKRAAWAVPSAQSKKEPRRGSFSLRGHPYWRMRIRLQGFPCNLHPNLQPSAKRDILQVGRGLAPAVCVKDAVHLTPQTGETRWGARSGRTAPRGSPRQSRMPAGRSADNSRSSATRCA